MRTPTDHESLLIEQGIQAEELIGHPTFIAVLNALSNQYLKELMATKPHESAKRDGFYHLTKATQDIVSTLNEWIAVKDELAEILNTEIEE